MLSRIPMIAVTGGPCGGKSTFLVKVRDWLWSHGIYAIIVPEVATELINSGVTPVKLGMERFQQILIPYMLEREKRYREAAKMMAAGGYKVVLLCDRGVMDSLGYVSDECFQALIKLLGLPAASMLMLRYSMVVHLVTAADGAEEFYTFANNPARSESSEEARIIDRRLQQAWMLHPHQFIVDNSTDFNKKMLRALQALARVLEMPEPTEIERKFLVRNFTREMIPEGAVEVVIRQDYLVSQSGVERRVRCADYAGESAFTYTEKELTGTPGKRIEREKPISFDEYIRLLEERDLNLLTVGKTRYCFLHEGRRFELDIYSPVSTATAGLVVLEVELTDLSEAVEFPPNWELEEVTGDERYSNHSLAERR